MMTTLAGPLPKLVVFDLDYTLWPLWVDTHIDPPLKRRGTTLNEMVDRSGQRLSFYADVPSILFDLRRAGVPIAAASRTSAPRIARQALQGLWIVDSAVGEAAQPVPAHDLFVHQEIYPGSKVSHFRRIADATGVEFADMLFFDDEHRNAEVQSKLGVHFVEVGTQGLDRATFQRGLEAWQKKRRTNAKST
ncbi:acid phosphatase [Malassezia pachydermatis]|uniref:Magnesium-dependent phosphatase-1 n=1 Tax=Malassezia pachydermatis TaxID=77020 RepID=A0A0M8MKV7_9BASI|nr:magnesium-dependent phosphatase-1 [Malassezia pachydermatis]KOS14526.1 magnesium-dependent phosphatase-1 [Malassezia pachydermatis]